MTKKKSKSEVETLRGVNRNLRKQIKHLQKQIGRKEKREYLLDDVEEREAELHLKEQLEESEFVSTGNCPECDVGKLELVELGNRVLVNCNTCKYRSTKKI